jgi:DNA-binding transcriptional MerR regulator/methylmalonyl-CoA mutase cobalamin-binding subunit
MDEPCHTIKVAAKLTGLTTHVIRVWEKRYGAVVPSRSDSQRRLFNDADLQRLTLLRQATGQGHSIGTIARLDNDGLRGLVRRMESASGLTAASAGQNHGDASPAALSDLVDFIVKFNHQALEDALTRFSVALGAQGLLLKVVAPLTQIIGERWQAGELNAAHEHFASAAIREYLLKSKPFAALDHAPVLLVATPAGQLHELGAVMVACAALNQGWKVIYLGASLPAAELAGAAMQSHARAVALSIVFPEDDPNLAGELVNLRRYLSPEIKILAGRRRATARPCGGLARWSPETCPGCSKRSSICGPTANSAVFGREPSPRGRAARFKFLFPAKPAVL